MIQSPLSNKTYTSNNVLLDFSLINPGDWGRSQVATPFSNKVVNVIIYLDGKPSYDPIQVNSNLVKSPFNYSENDRFKRRNTFFTALRELRRCTGNGYTSPMVNNYIPYSSNSDIVNFTVDSTPPNIVVLPIENQINGVPDVPVNFTVNKATTQITYSLDGNDNVTIVGNTTLTDLTYGEHNITVYATDLAENIGASKSMIFTVIKPATPFPIVS